MKTKEAIEFIENILKSKRFVWGEYEYTFFKNIISLLQQVEQMWEELYVIHGNTIVDEIASLSDVMEILEQKYFPQPVKAG